jgi:membrane protein implicated in regulation of membrane protease activity
MRSMDGERDREGGSLEGDLETLENFGRRGSIVGGVGLVRFSGSTWRVKHRETLLVLITW